MILWNCLCSDGTSRPSASSSANGIWKTWESSSAVASTSCRPVSMPSRPSISPPIWKPVTCSRPRLEEMTVLKKPVQTEYRESKRSPARKRTSPWVTLRRTETRRSSICPTSSRVTPKARHSSLSFQSDRLLEEVCIALPVRCIATARCGFEARAVEDRQLAAPVPDELGALQGGRGAGDANPAHAEHVGEELMRHAERVAAGPVVAHQQPARQARADLVKAQARRRG